MNPFSAVLLSPQNVSCSLGDCLSQCLCECRGSLLFSPLPPPLCLDPGHVVLSAHWAQGSIPVSKTRAESPSLWILVVEPLNSPSH